MRHSNLSVLWTCRIWGVNWPICYLGPLYSSLELFLTKSSVCSIVFSFDPSYDAGHGPLCNKCFQVGFIVFARPTWVLVLLGLLVIVFWACYTIKLYFLFYSLEFWFLIVSLIFNIVYFLWNISWTCVVIFSLLLFIVCISL